MALPFGGSWLCTLLLWACMCSPFQKGYNTAHGFSLRVDEPSSRADMFGPQSSNQFNPEASLNANQHANGPWDEMQPVHRENNEYDSSGFNEESQSEPPSEQDVSSAPPLQDYEREVSSYQHPFDLLVKEHTQEKTEGTSFPTIPDFKRFIKKMKSSFLMPRNDLEYFQPAREIMEKEIASENPDTVYRSNSAGEGTAHNYGSENEVWSEAMNPVFEQSEQGASYQSESLSVPDPVDSTQSLTSTRVYNGQESGLGSALYPPHVLAAAEHVSSNYGSFDSAGIPTKNLDFISDASHVQNEDFQSTSYQLPEQIPSGSFFGKDSTFNSPSQDFSNYSRQKSNITPLTSEKNIQQPTHTSHSKDSFTDYHKQSDLSKDFQKEEAGRVPPASVLSAPILDSYGHSVYVSAPRRLYYISDYVTNQKERPAKSFQAYQPTVGKESKDINAPNIHLPGFTGSGSSSSDERHGGYLSDQKISVSRPSIQTPQAEKKSDLSSQLADNTLTPISSGLDLTQSGISSQLGVGDWSVNSLTNLAPTSASERAFPGYTGNEIMSRNFKNMISHIRGAKTPLSSFPTPISKGISLNSGYVSATRSGLPETFIRPTKVWKRPANVNKESGNMAYWPPKPLSASKVSASTLSGVVWRNGGNTKRLSPQAGPNMSPPSVTAYMVKSRNGYVRSKVSLSKTRYAPNQLDEYKNTMQGDVRNNKGGST